jgi:sortase A
MRKFFAFLVVFLLIAAGVGYLLYPTISDQIGQAEDGAVMKAYREKAAAMSSQQVSDMLAGAAEYNATLENIRITDPFSTEARTSRDYQNRLNVHSGVIGELVIPAIGIYLPVYHNCGETPATRKLVHLETSSLPSDEAGTSIVLAGPGTLKAEGFLGEIGLTDERMLQDLDRLTPGDVIILNVLDRTMVYRIGEGLEEKDAILMLTPGGVSELDLSVGTIQEEEPEPTPTPEPRWTPKPTATPDPEATAEAEAAQEETVATPEETPEPTPTPTPESAPEPEPEEAQVLKSDTEQLTLLTPWRDQKLLVVRSARIPITEARALLNSTDRATYPEAWQNVLLLGCPVLLVGFLVMFIIERIKKRSYMLPDEGRGSARREKKNKAKLDTLTTEKQEENHEKADSENPEHSDRPSDADGHADGTGGGQEG